MAARLKQHLEWIPAALRAVHCFRDWPRDVLDPMEAAAELWRFAKGESVAERGDSPQGLWIVAAGSLTSHRATPTGKYYLQGVLWPGHIIGLMPILDGWPMPLSHAARRESLVVFVPRAALAEALNNARCLRDLCVLMCTRSRGDYEGLFSSNADSLSCRLAKMLAFLPRRAIFPPEGSPGGAGQADPAPIDLAQDELASMLGLARQTLNRALQPFLQDGIVVRQGDAIRVVNFKKLLARMEEDEPLSDIWRDEILSWDERLRQSDPGIAKLAARDARL